MTSPLGESRGGTPEGELPLNGGRAAPDGAVVAKQRFPAFRFPFCFRGFGETGLSEETRRGTTTAIVLSGPASRFT
jgi:hypothetical protein